MDMNKKELLVEPLFKCRLFIWKQANKKKKKSRRVEFYGKRKRKRARYSMDLSTLSSQLLSKLTIFRLLIVFQQKSF